MKIKQLHIKTGYVGVKNFLSSHSSQFNWKSVIQPVQHYVYITFKSAPFINLRGKFIGVTECSGPDQNPS